MARSAFLQSLVDAGVSDENEVDGLMLKFNARNLDVANHLFSTLQAPALKTRAAQMYAGSIGKAHVALDRTLFQAEALEKMEPDAARRLECIPLYILADVLTVAMVHPEEAATVAEVSRVSGHAVSAVFAFPQEIESSIEIHYRSDSGFDRSPREITAQAGLSGQMPASAPGGGGLVRSLLLHALKNNASDIHVQPMASSLAVRLRIDGQLQTLLTLEKDMLAPVISHLKLVSSLDFAEKRRPQDGRVSLEHEGRSHDFRLSIVPGIFGEKAVIRAVGSSDKRVTPLDQLGFSRRNHALLDKLIQRPHGVLLVTGPTGSGKTTTLYSLLTELQSPEINIVTVEDPVELRIEGITQIQTHAAIGLDFEQVLRAVLRQDPEVLLIGEIRDLETARIAMQAALTGHLVMATLHTNNAVQAVARLVDMGVEPFQVAPSVIGVLAQRLVRRICEHCKERYEPEEHILDSLFCNRGGGAQAYFYRGRGCAFCRGSGYSGRLGIHEIFALTDDLREMISNGKSLIEIQREALRRGFQSMRHDGLMKVLQGQTTLEEVERATMP